MAKINRMVRDMPLRKTFVLCILSTLAAALLLSALTIWGCFSVQNWLLPNKEEAVLSLNAVSADGSQETKITMTLQPGKEIPLLMTDSNNPMDFSYTFDKIENSYKTLSPKRQLVYVTASAAMIIMPVLYCIIGILLCAFWFYKHKLKEPLAVLEKATNQIAQQDLDFKITYEGFDELGKLCSSFEEMRAALLQVNREMWEMLEERQKLQASITHDLRNPIAIIKGYAEYLQINLPKGNITTEQNVIIANNLAASADRLERYTESVRHINQLASLEIHSIPCRLSQYLDTAAADMSILAEQHGINLHLSAEVPEAEIMMDTENYSRVLENIVQNALRFAGKKVSISWKLEDVMLITTITDDGPGFPIHVLKRKNYTIFSTDSEHIGMGLTVSEILCRKHGGTLKLFNEPGGGAAVQFTFRIQ